MSTQGMYLFYSNRCAHSKELIQELYKNGIYDMFEKVCVDTLKVIPKGITSVPTMIVARYPRPLVGKECFAWLNGIKQQQQSVQQQTPNAQNGQLLPGASGAPSGQHGGVQVSNSSSGETNAMAGSNGIPGFEDIIPFSDTMGGFSDGYSYLSDERPMEHSFAFIGSNEMAPQQAPTRGGGIQTPQEITTNDKQSALNQALEQLREARARDMQRM
jgi:hypothetical protein